MSSTTKPYHLKQFGTWTEQQSSAGKRYFYNRETEVSQWEKPAEWREQERLLRQDLRNKKGVSKATASTSTTDVYGSAIPNDPINANSNTGTSAKLNSVSLTNVSQKPTSSPIVTNVSLTFLTTTVSSSQPQKRAANNAGSLNNQNLPFQKAFGYKTPQQLYDDMSVERASLKATETHHHLQASTSQESTAIKINSSSTIPNNNFVTKNFQNQKPLLNTNFKKEENSDSIDLNVVEPQSDLTILPFQQQPKTIPPKKSNFGQAGPNMPKHTSKNNSVWVFREERYTKFYRVDLTHSRRSLNNDTLKNEIKKYSDRSNKQILGLESLDNTIKSINSLIKIAEVRSGLSKHRLNFIRSTITSLETKTSSL